MMLYFSLIRGAGFIKYHRSTSSTLNRFTVVNIIDVDIDLLSLKYFAKILKKKTSNFWCKDSGLEQIVT